ncbi:uncharacterized protein RSE6_03733 [Rhynchosporium secalis]|uniref:Uncharacterized protein n=1 Tax=Rhynchosporium secalis TaxID=38038 RepID=A0A1E1M3I3_RHYSE|nr:uncharacterized protein RSE6_03733 [Rhynchosporium secalis]
MASSQLLDLGEVSKEFENSKNAICNKTAWPSYHSNPHESSDDKSTVGKIPFKDWRSNSSST